MKALNITIRLGSLKILLHWSIWLWPVAALLMGFFSGDPTRMGFLLRYSGLLFVSILIHELAHWIAATLVFGSAGRITIFAIGGMVHGTGISRLMRRGSLWKQAFVISAGCVANLTIAAVLFAIAYWQLLWIPSATRNIFIEFILINLTIGVLNLTPFHLLDGGRLFQIVLMSVRLSAPVRNRIECGVYTLSGGGLLWLSIFTRDYILAGIVSLLFLLLWQDRKGSAKTARAFENRSADRATNDAMEKIPPKYPPNDPLGTGSASRDNNTGQPLTCIHEIQNR